MVKKQLVLLVPVRRHCTISSTLPNVFSTCESALIIVNVIMPQVSNVDPCFHPFDKSSIIPACRSKTGVVEYSSRRSTLLGPLVALRVDSQLWQKDCFVAFEPDTLTMDFRAENYKDERERWTGACGLKSSGVLHRHGR